MIPCSLAIPLIIDASPIAFALENELANTGICRVCNELIRALSALKSHPASQFDLVIYSPNSRWHNALVRHCVNDLLKLDDILFLSDPCDIAISAFIENHKDFGISQLESIRHAHLPPNTINGLSASDYLSSSTFYYFTTYLSAPREVRLNKNAKIIHHIHDLFPLTNPSFFHGGIDSLWLRKRSDFYPEDHYFCISSFTAQCILDLFPYIPESHVHVGLNSGEHILETQQLSSTDELSLLNQNALKKGEYFVTVSTLEPRKNLPLLIRAFKLFRESSPKYASFKLALVGATGWLSESQSTYLKSQIESDSIVFCGRANDSEMRSLVSCSCAYVSSSSAEGFGLGLVESMFLGILPIAPQNTSQQEVVEPIGFTYKNNSATDLTSKMIMAAQQKFSPTFVASKASTAFSWQSTAQKLLCICKDIVNTP